MRAPQRHHHHHQCKVQPRQQAQPVQRRPTGVRPKSAAANMAPAAAYAATKAAPRPSHPLGDVARPARKVAGPVWLAAP